jgi:hypothetical protein
MSKHQIFDAVIGGFNVALFIGALVAIAMLAE